MRTSDYYHSHLLKSQLFKLSIMWSPIPHIEQNLGVVVKMKNVWLMDECTAILS